MNPKKNTIKSPQENKRKEDNLSIFNYKLEYLKWFLTILFAIVTYGIVAKLIIAFYEPDISQAIELAKSISIATSGFAPEPKEKFLFIAAVIIFTISISVFYFLANKYLSKIRKKILQFFYIPSFIVSISLIIFITYRGFISTNPFATTPQNSQDIVGKTNADFYFTSTFIYNHFHLFLFLLFPLILCTFIYKYNFSTNALQLINKVKEIVVYGFCCIIILIIFCISTFKFPYTVENKYDFNAVYYSTVQVYHGLPLLVDNFTTTYGLYSHFLIPILKITGLNVLAFSSIMAFLSSLCFIFILLFLKKTINNKLLVLFGFTTLFFNCYMYSRIVANFDSVFSLCPIRWILPCTLIFYSTFYLRNKSRKKYLFSFFLFSLGILWNPDFGILTYLTLLAFYSFLELNQQDLKTILKKIIAHLFFAIIILSITLFTYSLIIKLLYGESPELLKIFSTIKVYSIIGFAMLPMSSDYHPWIIVALTYLIGLLYSAYAVINKKHTYRTSIVFLLTALGIASFSYYQGRSHNWNLFASNFPAFLLLTVFADDLLQIIPKQKIFIAPFSLLLFFLSFSFFQTVYDYKKIIDLVMEKTNKLNNQREQKNIVNSADFIHSLTKENEKVLIVSATHYQGLYYDLSETYAAVNPGLCDLFLKSDYDRIIEFITKNDSTKIFFEPGSYRYHDNRIPTVLSSLYKIVKTQDNSTLMLLTKKKKDSNANFILKQEKDDVLHEILDNDLSKKLDYAYGKNGKISLDTQFSVEIIFKPVTTPTSPYTNWATIACNDNGEKGFRIQQKDSVQTIYYIAIDHEGISCPVVPNKWNYLYFEIGEKKIKAFSNGQFVGIQHIQSTYLNSEEPIYIGNYKQQAGFFFGDIREIRISHNLVEEKDIHTYWEKIKVL